MDFLSKWGFSDIRCHPDISPTFQGFFHPPPHSSLQISPFAKWSQKVAEKKLHILLMPICQCKALNHQRAIVPVGKFEAHLEILSGSAHELQSQQGMTRQCRFATPISSSIHPSACMCGHVHEHSLCVCMCVRVFLCHPFS